MITITRSDLERAVPVATSKDDNIFDLLDPALQEESSSVEKLFLGDPGCQEYSTNQTLQLFAKKVVCLRAFTRQFRQLDLVLTATGFGVVSTQDLAPASKMRTDALLSQLHVDRLRSEASLIDVLRTVDQWWDTPQRVANMPTLFWNVDLLSLYAGRDTITVNEWRLAQPVIITADNFLRRHVGNDFMDTVVAITAGMPDDDENADARAAVIALLVPVIQQYIGLCVAADHNGAHHHYQRLMNILESNLRLFPEYADSEAYRANHYEGYQNTADSTAFFFQG